MKNQILDKIECTSTAKEKISNCSRIIQEFVFSLNKNQLEKFWDVQRVIEEYHTYIQDEIFRQLL